MPTDTELHADCSRCFAICCVGPAFFASADFAINKPAGHPCPNLGRDFRCTIHDQLRPQGFSGCVSYDCFGAGQKVAQHTFAGRDWRAFPDTAERLFAVFGVMRRLHEMLWYLDEARTLPAAATLRDELDTAFAETERRTFEEPEALARLDVAAHRRGVSVLLRRASDLARAGTNGADLSRADLTGRDFRGADLRGANFRGAFLLGADLTGADLNLADLTGADLRAADLRRADLGTAIFLTQAQLDAATGDHGTRLPPARHRPVHW